MASRNAFPWRVSSQGRVGSPPGLYRPEFSICQTWWPWQYSCPSPRRSASAWSPELMQGSTHQISHDGGQGAQAGSGNSDGSSFIRQKPSGTGSRENASTDLGSQGEQGGQGRPSRVVRTCSKVLSARRPSASSKETTWVPLSRAQGNSDRTTPSEPSGRHALNGGYGSCKEND